MERILAISITTLTITLLSCIAIIGLTIFLETRVKRASTGTCTANIETSLERDAVPERNPPPSSTEPSMTGSARLAPFAPMDSSSNPSDIDDNRPRSSSESHRDQVIYEPNNTAPLDHENMQNVHASHSVQITAGNVNIETAVEESRYVRRSRGLDDIFDNPPPPVPARARGERLFIPNPPVA